MKDTPDWLQDVSITVHNDDHSPFDGVVALLRRCVGFGEDNARNWARHIDRNGSATLGPWSASIATEIHAELERLAPRYGCASLRVTLERNQTEATPPKASSRKAHHVLGEHFHGVDLTEVVIVKREFPTYLRVDVQRAVEAAAAGARRVGVHSRTRWDASDLASLISERDQAKVVGALQFDDIDIGEDSPVRLATNCLSLFERDGVPVATWVNTRNDEANQPQLSVEVATPAGDEPGRIVGRMLNAIEEAVASGRSYRGKVLSLEASESFNGLAARTLTVHFREAMGEDELILPTVVRAALERHIVDFAANRRRLVELGQSGRKGVLLYGPPGTGKTHTVRYLAQRLSDHTTFLVTAEQVGLIDVYFRLARLFAPSMLVLEDADLIARQRESMASACDQVLLNRLLNEMDGLRRDAEILVVMTTNRPEVLEEALLQRPGRIDHAIEVPVPDADCRARLIRLYGKGLSMAAGEVDALVARTSGVTASFIKELARRLAQHSIEAGRAGSIAAADVDTVLTEMLGERDSLNMRLLGGAAG